MSDRMFVGLGEPVELEPTSPLAAEIPADAAAADEELRAANAGRKRGLFGR